MSEKQKLLIVDDSELNRDILKEILGSSYDYLEAENGNQSKLCEKRMIWGSQTISADRLMQLS